MKILIVKTSSLGDIVHAFPAVSLLKKKFPDAQIDWVVEKPFAEMVVAHPYINKVIPIQTKKWRKKLFSKETYTELKEVFGDLSRPYDLLFDLQGNTKSAAVTALAKAKTKIGYGLKTVWEYPNLLATNLKFDPPLDVNVRDENLFLVKRYLKTEESADDRFLLKLKESEQEFLNKFTANLPTLRKIFVAPGSNWQNKQVDDQQLAQFLNLINNEQKSHFLLIYGNAVEKQAAERISKSLSSSTLVDKLSLPLLQNLMAHMDLVIAMDSLPLHLAAAAGTPTFSIFGPSAAAKFAPIGKDHTAIQGTCPYNKTFNRRCSILRTCPTGACIKNLTGSMLFNSYLQNRQR